MTPLLLASTQTVIVGTRRRSTGRTGADVLTPVRETTVTLETVRAVARPARSCEQAAMQDNS
jgi:hypothetical protein